MKMQYSNLKSIKLKLETKIDYEDKENNWNLQ